jgi:hypothetical protein
MCYGLAVYHQYKFAGSPEDTRRVPYGRNYPCSPGVTVVA